MLIRKLVSQMANETKITVVGNLGADPTLRYTKAGNPVVNFSVATTPRIFDRESGEWSDGQVMFLNATAWKGLAENIAESFTKGSHVILTGNLQASAWEDEDGNKRVSYEISVDEIGQSVMYGVSTFEKAEHVDKAPAKVVRGRAKVSARK